MCIRHSDAPESATAPAELGIAPKRGHVVDELRAERERAPRDLGAGRVDRDAPAVEPLEHRDDAAELLVERDVVRSGSRRFTADVDDRGPVGKHLHRRVGSRVRIDVRTAVGEAVRRDVDDPDHRRPRPTFAVRRSSHRAWTVTRRGGAGRPSGRSRSPSPSWSSWPSSRSPRPARCRPGATAFGGPPRASSTRPSAFSSC